VSIVGFCCFAIVKKELWRSITTSPAGAVEVAVVVPVVGIVRVSRHDLDLTGLTPRTPETQRDNVRVWNVRRTEHSRTNLVEMKGKLPYHRHPDAEHTIYVLEGRLCAWHGREAVVLEVGDYFSIPAGLAHKYQTLTPTALILSFDAPAYDPNLTEAVSEEGANLAPCPAP